MSGIDDEDTLALEPEPAAEQSPPPQGQGLASAAVLMVAVTLISRVAGLLRSLTIAAVFGVSGPVNAFFAAFAIPDLLYFLMAGGAARTAFVPVFTEYLAHGRRREAWRVFSSVFWLLAILGAVLVVLGVGLAPQLARLSALGWVQSDPDRVSSVAHFMRIIFPAQLFLVLGGLLMGTLNAHKHFLWPAVGPIVYDLFSVAGALAAGVMIHHGASQLEGLNVLAASTVLGALCGNVLVQIPPLARLGGRLQLLLDVADSGVRRVVRLAGPVILGLAVAEINWVLVRALATMCGDEDAVALLELANRLWKLPSGLFAAAIAIAVFPSLSEHYARRDEVAYRRDFSFAMRNTLFFVIPSTVVFASMPTPIVRMLLQRGSFSPETSPILGEILVWLTPGMLALAIVYICARAFYARHNTLTPVVVGLASFVACFTVGYASLPMGVLGLALATSVSNGLNALLLMVLLKRQVGRLDGGRILSSLVRIIPGCVALGLICHFGSGHLESLLGNTGEPAKLITAMVPLALGALVFVALCILLRVEELASGWRLLTRRRPRASAGQ